MAGGRHPLCSGRPAQRVDSQLQCTLIDWRFVASQHRSCKRDALVNEQSHGRDAALHDPHVPWGSRRHPVAARAATLQVRSHAIRPVARSGGPQRRIVGPRVRTIRAPGSVTTWRPASPPMRYETTIDPL